MAKILHVHFKARNNVGDAAVVLAVRQLVEGTLGSVSWTSMLMKGLRDEPSTRLLRHIDSHDLVIIGGGGFCSKYALPLNDRLIEAIETPIVLFGIGHNRHLGDPGLDDDQRRSLALLGRKAALCGVRDRMSQRLLGELGVQAALTGDPAIFLAPRKPWWPPPRRSPAIGFNIACHGWGRQEALFGQVFELYREVIGRLSAQRNADLFYMVHTNREMDAAKRLRRAFPALRICNHPAPQLRYMYGRLDLVVSMMLHSSILAFASGVPVVNIAYDEKNRAFLEDIGHPERCFDAGSATAAQVLNACEQILDGPPDADDAGLRDGYSRAMRAFVEQVAALAHGPAAG